MKKILLIITILTTFIAISGCKFWQNNETPTEGLLMNAGEKVNLKNFNPETLEYQSFLDKLELFSAKLSTSIYNKSDKNENLCISPVSIYMALAMTIGSASETAKQELLSAIGLTDTEVNNFTKYLYAYLKMERYKYDDIIKVNKLA